MNWHKILPYYSFFILTIIYYIKYTKTVGILRNDGGEYGKYVFK